jgi:streptogramin lyase
VGTYPTGVNFYDRSSDAITVLKPTSDPNTGLLDKTVEAVTEDNAGNVWIGAGGVTRYNPEEARFAHYRNTPVNPGIKTQSPIVGYTDSEGGIWFGSWANSYHHYNPKTDCFDQMPFDATLAGTTLKNTKVLPDGVVWSVFEDRQKKSLGGNA